MALIKVKPLRKVTVHVQEDILKAAQEHTQSGITQTITEGLKKLAASRAYRKLGALEGTSRLELDLDELREDRDVS
jgi:hypothetical protein